MVRQFHSDPEYLAKYHLKSILVLAVANLVLAVTTKPDWKQAVIYLPVLLLLSSTNLTTVLGSVLLGAAITSFQSPESLWFLMGLPAAILVTFPLTGLLHCVAHNSVRPRWLNRPLGEMIGLIQLSGFPDWTIIHVIHHIHVDDPKLDPHPPVGKTYWAFAKGMRQSVMSAFLKFYFKKFGQTPQSMKSIQKLALLMKVDSLLKIGFWYLILGGPLFTSFFAFSIGFKMLHYAWFNYATHKADGIHNLKNHIYKVLNPLTFGLYYHGNHHHSPNLFDPRSMPSEVQPNPQPQPVRERSVS